MVIKLCCFFCLLTYLLVYTHTRFISRCPFAQDKSLRPRRRLRGPALAPGSPRGLLLFVALLLSLSVSFVIPCIFAFIETLAASVAAGFLCKVRIGSSTLFADCSRICVQGLHKILCKFCSPGAAGERQQHIYSARCEFRRVLVQLASTCSTSSAPPALVAAWR